MENACLSEDRTYRRRLHTQQVLPVDPHRALFPGRDPKRSMFFLLHRSPRLIACRTATYCRCFNCRRIRPGVSDKDRDEILDEPFIEGFMTYHVGRGGQKVTGLDSCISHWYISCNGLCPFPIQIHGVDGYTSWIHIGIACMMMNVGSNQRQHFIPWSLPQCMPRLYRHLIDRLLSTLAQPIFI